MGMISYRERLWNGIYYSILGFIWLSSAVGSIIFAKMSMEIVQSPMLLGLAQLAFMGLTSHAILCMRFNHESNRYNSSDIALLVKMALIHVGNMLLLNLSLLLCPIHVVEQIQLAEPIAHVVIAYAAFRRDSKFTKLQLGMLVPIGFGIGALVFFHSSSSYIIPGVALSLIAHAIANIYSRLFKSIEDDMSVPASKLSILLHIHRYAGIFQTFFVLVVNIPHVYPYYHNPRGQNTAHTSLFTLKSSGLLVASGMCFTIFSFMSIYLQNGLSTAATTCSQLVRSFTVISCAVIVLNEHFSTNDAISTLLCVFGSGFFYHNLSHYQACCHDLFSKKEFVMKSKDNAEIEMLPSDLPLQLVHHVEEDSDDDFEMIEKSEYFDRERIRMVK